MKKIYFVVGLIIFLNLGNFLDLTNTPKKSDVIVILGGEKSYRIKKGLELYRIDFSISKKVIFTGLWYDMISNRFYFQKSLKENNLDKNNIINLKNVSNTFEELLEIKSYLLKNNLHSVLFVTHPTHTLRIKILANLLEDYDKENIKINFASADHTKVWSSQFYFLEWESIKLVFLEYLKIVYNLVKYSIFL